MRTLWPHRMPFAGSSSVFAESCAGHPHHNEKGVRTASQSQDRQLSDSVFPEARRCASDITTTTGSSAGFGGHRGRLTNSVAGAMPSARLKRLVAPEIA